MGIKLYEPCFNGNGDPAMAESPNGKYCSRADLIAAGVLVPVPDGEAVDISLCEHRFFLDEDGELYECSPDGDGAGREVRHFTNGMGGYFSDTIVQPVRLVRLEDVG